MIYKQLYERISRAFFLSFFVLVHGPERVTVQAAPVEVWNHTSIPLPIIKVDATKNKSYDMIWAICLSTAKAGDKWWVG